MNDKDMENHLDYETLSAFVDNEANDAQHIESHLKDCASCRNTVDTIRAMHVALHNAPRPETNRAFTEKVMARVAAEETAATPLFGHRTPLRRYQRPVYALAATVLVLIAGGWLFQAYLDVYSGESPAIGPITLVETESDPAGHLGSDLPEGLDASLFADTFQTDSTYSDVWYYEDAYLDDDTTLLLASDPGGYDQVLEYLDEISFDELLMAVAANIPKESLESYEYPSAYLAQADVWEDLMALDEDTLQQVLHRLDNYLTRG